jgi:hypothetical protein
MGSECHGGYRKNSLFVSTGTKMNPVYTLLYNLFKTYFNIILPFKPRSGKWLLFIRFSLIKLDIHTQSFQCYFSNLYNPSCLRNPNNILRAVRITKPFVMQFFPAFFSCLRLGSKLIIPSTPCSFLNDSDQFSH